MAKIFKIKKVRTKIILAFLGIISLMVVVDIFAGIKLLQIRKTVNKISTLLVSENKASTNMITSFLSARFYANRYLIYRNQSEIDMFNEETDNFIRNLNEYKKIILKREKLSIVNNINAKILNYKELFYEINGLTNDIADKRTSVIDFNKIIIDNKISSLKFYLSLIKEKDYFLLFDNFHISFQSFQINFIKYFQLNNESFYVFLQRDIENMLNTINNLENKLKDNKQKENCLEIKKSIYKLKDGVYEIKNETILIRTIYENQFKNIEKEILTSVSDIKKRRTGN
ncbi:MAG TPA: hypothetical protein PLO89_05865 [Spirochaetota bacterium]|nr:hypothetical protein [Spirochaetota bacterium]